MGGRHVRLRHLNTKETTMADNDRYSNDDNRDRLGQREVYMDNRTGIGAPGRGYRADWGRGRDDRHGDRDNAYNQRNTETASFRDRERGQPDGGDYRGNYYGEGGYYTGAASRFSGESYSSDRDRYGTSNPSYSSSYGGRGRQYGRNENWQTYSARSNPEFYADEYGSAGPGWAEDFTGRDRGRYEERYNRGNEAAGDYGASHHRAYGPDDRDRGDGRGWWDRAADKVASWFGGDEGRDYEAGRQSYRGKGPKNYRRSDERVKEDVSDRLSDDHWLDASEIEVTVSSGEVTLSGMVKTRDDKRRAEQLAEQVSGVDNVQNNIRVQKPGAEGWRAGDTTTAGATTIPRSTTEFGSTSDGSTTSNLGDLGTTNTVRGGKTTQ
jgi:osmotically-inducible protein OsmY